LPPGDRGMKMPISGAAPPSADATPVTPTPLPIGSRELLTLFGPIDIHLFDQLLRGRINPGMRVLDAGCGGGRNATYLLRCGADIHGVDRDPLQIQRIRSLARELAPGLPPERFLEARLTNLPHPDGSFDAVICSAVLHFATDQAEFEGMMAEMWRVLAPGGIFFARLASTIGIEEMVTPLGGRWHHLPDGSDRFLVDEAYLMEIGDRLGGVRLDPLKTTVVQGLRAMTTWVLSKGPEDGGPVEGECRAQPGW